MEQCWQLVMTRAYWLSIPQRRERNVGRIVAFVELINDCLAQSWSMLALLE